MITTLSAIKVIAQNHDFGIRLELTSADVIETEDNIPIHTDDNKLIERG